MTINSPFGVQTLSAEFPRGTNLYSQDTLNSLVKRIIERTKTTAKRYPMNLTSKITYKFTPDYAVHPGETIKEWQEIQGTSDEEFAEQLDVSTTILEQLFAGEQPINKRLANRLELAIGIPASFWMKLEANYRKLKSENEV